MESNFFIWYIEDTEDDRDGIIARQRNNICSLKKRLKVSRKWIKMLLLRLFVVVVINIVMLSIFLNFP